MLSFWANTMGSVYSSLEIASFCTVRLCRNPAQNASYFKQFSCRCPLQRHLSSMLPISAWFQIRHCNTWHAPAFYCAFRIIDYCTPSSILLLKRHFLFTETTEQRWLHYRILRSDNFQRIASSPQFRRLGTKDFKHRHTYFPSWGTSSPCNNIMSTKKQWGHQSLNMDTASWSLSW